MPATKRRMTPAELAALQDQPRVADAPRVSHAVQPTQAQLDRAQRAQMEASAKRKREDRADPGLAEKRRLQEWTDQQNKSRYYGADARDPRLMQNAYVAPEGKSSDPIGDTLRGAAALAQQRAQRAQPVQQNQRAPTATDGVRALQAQAAAAQGIPDESGVGRASP